MTRSRPAQPVLARLARSNLIVNGCHEGRSGRRIGGTQGDDAAWKSSDLPSWLTDDVNMTRVQHALAPAVESDDRVCSRCRERLRFAVAIRSRAAFGCTCRWAQAPVRRRDYPVVCVSSKCPSHLLSLLRNDLAFWHKRSGRSFQLSKLCDDLVLCRPRAALQHAGADAEGAPTETRRSCALRVARQHT